MTLSEFKIKLLETGLFRKTSGDGQYRCDVCPFCGDTKKHMYVLIKPGEDTPILYNCFKCNAHGFMNEKFLNYFGIDNLRIPVFTKKGYHKLLSKSVSHYSDIDETLLDETKHSELIAIASEYIQSRVGVRPTLDDLKAFRVIGDPQEYVQTYIGGKGYGLSDRIWFKLSNGTITGRKVSDDEERWRKYTGELNQQQIGYGMYIIKTAIDPYRPINICIAEGIFDCIGLYYNGNIPNAVFIACLGRNYINGLKYTLDMGIFGDSVQIRYYMDSDVSGFNMRSPYDKLFHSVSQYKNAIGKDYGLPADKIQIEKQ